MLTIPRNLIEETTLHHFTAEVSELRSLLSEGIPDRLIVPNLGNGQHLVATEVERDTDGTWQLVKYNQIHGCVSLTIFND